MQKTRSLDTSRHLTRKQLLQEAAKPETDRAGHLRECAECREALELLRVYRMAGRAPLPEPPSAWVTRARLISSASGSALRAVRDLVAGLVFDSWAMPQPVGVRGQATLGQRRISFAAEDILFDLRAEQHKGEWRFVAQATAAGRATGELISDRRVLLPDRDGIYQWSAPRPPRKMVLQIENTRVTLPELTWTRPRAKRKSSDT